MVVRHGSAGSGKTKAGSDPVERRLSLLILLYSSSTKRTSFTLEHYVHLGLRERLTDRSPVTKSPLPVLPFRLVARPSGINLKKVLSGRHTQPSYTIPIFPRWSGVLRQPDALLELKDPSLFRWWNLLHPYKGKETWQSKRSPFFPVSGFSIP